MSAATKQNRDVVDVCGALCNMGPHDCTDAELRELIAWLRLILDNRKGRPMSALTKCPFCHEEGEVSRLTP